MATRCRFIPFRSNRKAIRLVRVSPDYRDSVCLNVGPALIERLSRIYPDGKRTTEYNPQVFFDMEGQRGRFQWNQPVTRGWGNYFALAHYHRIFRQMNGFTANRPRQWLWRKHGNASGKYRRWPDYQLFQNHGLYELPTRVT